MRNLNRCPLTTFTAVALTFVLRANQVIAADEIPKSDAPSLVGIGVALKPPPSIDGEQRIQGAVEILQLVPNRPAHLCGEIEVGDLVTAVAQENGPPKSVDGLLFNELVNLMRGPVDSEVRLTLVPKNNRYVKSKVVAIRREPLVETDLIGKVLPGVDVLPLTGIESRNLESLRGSVVVLEFWTTSCAPCRAHIAEMQEAVRRNPAWAGSVNCLTVSVDESGEMAKAALAENEWTATLNVWGSEEVRTAFRADILPLVVVADAQGKMIAAGNPRSVNVERLVNALLRKQ